MLPKRRILIAEDDAGIRDLVRVRLSQVGYEAHVARNGLEAADRIRDLRPEGVILDINMPGMDGFGVLQFIARERDLRHVRVLVLTARHSAEDVKRAVSLGAKDYLSKPFSEAQLLARVGRLMGSPNNPGLGVARSDVRPAAAERPGPSDMDPRVTALLARMDAVVGDDASRA
jgi:two-component system OmpR family response regulator